MKKEFLHIKSPGFKIPENYFETIEEQLLDKIALQEVASSENPFQVPDGYFESSAEKTFAEAIQSEKTIKVIPLYKKKFISYAVAVAAIVLVAVSIFEFQKLKESTSEVYFTSSTLLENNYLDLSLIDIEYLITEDMLNEQQFLSTLNLDEIEDYLLYELDDTYLLYD